MNAGTGVGIQCFKLVFEILAIADFDAVRVLEGNVQQFSIRTRSLGTVLFKSYIDIA